MGVLAPQLNLTNTLTAGTTLIRAVHIQELRDGVLALYGGTGGGSGAEAISYYHTDGVGSVRMTTDGAGAVVARYDYLPFGQPWPSDTDPEPRRFAGYERDLTTGSTAHNWEAMDYAGARYYSSQTGRFTGADPIVNVSRSTTNPQRWNRYAYVLNNPFKFVDPDGRETQLVVGKHTRDNIFGHVAIAINGTVFSFGTNYTRGENRDWRG